MSMNEAMLGALEFRSGEKPDPIFEEVVSRLKSKNIMVRGVLQRVVPDPRGDSTITRLENIADGKLIRLSQDLGRKSSGCSLNPAALADASVSLEDELSKPMDIFIMNRFGHSESEGAGFRHLIESAYSRNIPVLLGVKDIYHDAWRDFSGSLAKPLPLDAGAITEWCCQTMQKTEPELMTA